MKKKVLSKTKNTPDLNRWWTPQNFKTPLSELLWADKIHKVDSSLKNNLGDGFLYLNNPIFRNVRDLFYELGFKFTEDDFCYYNVFLISTLEKMIEVGRVPVRDNCSILEKLENDYPGEFTTADFSFLVFNKVLHEPSHLIANRLFPQTQVSARHTLEEEQFLIFNMFVAEAFATLIDIMGAAFCHSDIHRELYSLNSYHHPCVERDSLVNHCISLLGFQVTFQIMHLGLFAGNFDPTLRSLKPAQKKLIYDFVICRKLKDSEKLIADSVMDLACTWDPGFRSFKTPFYLRTVMGCRNHFEDLINFDFMSLVVGSECLDKIKTLSECVEFGTKSKSLERLTSDLSPFHLATHIHKAA